MLLEEILKDKTLKAKDKVTVLANHLLDKSISTGELIDAASKAKDPVKATCIEALEYATKQQPGIADKQLLAFVTDALTDKAPRIKWESAKVVGNIAALFPAKLDDAVAKLIPNTEHDGTVVRWSAAYALGEILKLKTKLNKELLPALEAIAAGEEKNSIKKIYLDAIKKTRG